MTDRTARTVRSTRTRAALRRAAVTRFVADGVEATSVEDIAADAGVTVRTFYRHFASKHDLLFVDYDAGLRWFRAALAARPRDEAVLASVSAAVLEFPYDADEITELPALRLRELDPGQVTGHMRRVEADFAAAIEDHLGRRAPSQRTTEARLAVVVTARCIAAAAFAALELWIAETDRSLDELAKLSRAALGLLDAGLAAQTVPPDRSA